MKTFLIALIGVLLYNVSNAQALAFTDPAMAYNKLLLDSKDQNGYVRISNYKVIGTKFLYGGGQQAKIYVKGERPVDATTNYDTYDQKLEFLLSENSPSLTNFAKNIDSFTLKVKTTLLNGTLKFYNAAVFGGDNNFFVQQVTSDGRFQLYKKYYSVLSVVSTNYVDADLRQFDLNTDYYYFDTQKKIFKKLRLNTTAIKKEFKEIKDLSNALQEGFTYNAEGTLLNVFNELNN